ncbi:hypothetical protein BHE74_00036449, partial [Ensete ventricosum]
AQARRGEARAPHLISRRRASKRHRLSARPSPGAGRFGRAPGLYQTIISLSLSWNAEFKQEGTGVTLLQKENEGRNEPSSESGETGGAMRSSTAAGKHGAMVPLPPPYSPLSLSLYPYREPSCSSIL